MGVQLNIKDEATVRLARELARETGRSVTTTIREALERERRERLAHRDDWRRDLDTLVTEVRRTMPEEWRDKSAKEIMDSMYDEDGLPI